MILVKMRNKLGQCYHFYSFLLYKRFHVMAQEEEILVKHRRLYNLRIWAQKSRRISRLQDRALERKELHWKQTLGIISESLSSISISNDQWIYVRKLFKKEERAINRKRGNKTLCSHRRGNLVVPTSQTGEPHDAWGSGRILMKFLHQ